MRGPFEEGVIVEKVGGSVDGLAAAGVRFCSCKSLGRGLLPPLDLIW